MLGSHPGSIRLGIDKGVVMRASLKDIARQVGVSVSTVSYALNDGPKPVAADLKERIKAVAAELDYRPNQLAKSMKTRRSKIVGLAHTNIREHFLGLPMIGPTMSGVTDAAIDDGYDVLLYTHAKILDGEELLNYLLDGRADGMILVAPERSDTTIELVAGRNFPIVVVAGKPIGTAPHILLDNVAAMRLAIEHLRTLGHTKIGHLAGRQTLWDGEERKAAFQSICHEMNLEVRHEWIADTEFSLESGERAARAILHSKERPTALVCANDFTALGAVRAAQEIGLSVPEDLSLVGVDNSVEGMVSSVPLTTITFPFEEVGRAAFRAFMAKLDGQQPPRVQIFSPQLVVRSSTASPKKDIAS
ncbi:MAG: LacI family transcriptional regulator [Armatimonadetes bacterium]|nr:LacI family transcriptional regulator [Armatimonadota bacterium]